MLGLLTLVWSRRVYEKPVTTFLSVTWLVLLYKKEINVAVMHRNVREVAYKMPQKLREEELCNAYSPPNFVTTINSRSTRWAGHVAACDK
jgi:hypothetical protein